MYLFKIIFSSIKLMFTISVFTGELLSTNCMLLLPCVDQHMFFYFWGGVGWGGG
jgi:hypothetical protein